MVYRGVLQIRQTKIETWIMPCAFTGRTKTLHETGFNCYLVVNDLKACIQAIEKSKEKFDVLIVFKKALSVMISTKLRFGSQVFQLAE